MKAKNEPKPVKSFDINSFDRFYLCFWRNMDGRGPPYCGLGRRQHLKGHLPGSPAREPRTEATMSFRMNRYVRYGSYCGFSWTSWVGA
jgi:hypothetical protein